MDGYRAPSIAPYDPAWAARYAAEATTLRTAIPGLLRLEHFGSTSVPGLAAKPIVDIVAIVASVDALLADHGALADLGYRLRTDVFADDPLHLYLPKDIAGRRAVHLHVFATASPIPAANLLLRDFLRASAAGRERYAEAKRAIAAATATRAEYAAAKEPVMAELTAAAERWAAAG